MNYNEMVLKDRIDRNKEQIKLLKKLEMGVHLIRLVLKIQAVVFKLLIKLFNRQENLLISLSRVSRNNKYLDRSGKYQAQREFYENLLEAIK